MLTRAKQRVGNFSTAASSCACACHTRESKVHDKRDPFMCQKRPNYMTKETHTYDKRDPRPVHRELIVVVLFIWMNHVTHMNESRPTHESGMSPASRTCRRVACSVNPSCTRAHTHTHMHIHTHSHTHIHTHTCTHTQTLTCTHTYARTRTHTRIYTHTCRQADRQTNKQTDRQTNRQTDRQTDR